MPMAPVGMHRLIVLALGIILLGPAVPAHAGSPPPSDNDGHEPPMWLADADGPVDAILVFDTGTHGLVESVVRDLGLDIVERFRFIGALHVRGDASILARTWMIPGVVGMYPEEALTMNLAASRTMVNVDDVPLAPASLGAGVTVAVVDSGIDNQHPALADRLRASVRVSGGGIVAGAGDGDGHGTHVAGIVGGSGDASRDNRFRGVAPGAGLVAVDISESFTTTNAVRAFEWIHENHERYDIRVVSNSWGREKDDSRYDPNDPVIRASNALVAQGLVVVFSAGNNGDEDASLTVEAMNPHVISVGATSKTGRVESYSSRGPARDTAGRDLDWVKPDVVAPGTHIVSTRTTAKSGSLNGESKYYVEMNGTSMAAPHVAGAAAILLAAAPDLTPGLVQVILQDTARDLGPEGPDWAYGYGMIDVAAALRAAEARETNERVVLEERQIPFRASGQIVAAGDRIIITNLAPALPPEKSVMIPITVPIGARTLQFALTWDGAAGDLVAFLEGPGGTLGPYPAKGDRIDVALENPPAGAYRVDVRTNGPATLTQWAIAGSITVLEPHVVEGAGGARYNPRGGFERDADFFETLGSREVLAHLQDPLALGFIGLVVGGLAGLVALRRLNR